MTAALELVFRSFWTFAGFAFLLCIVTNLIFRVWNRFMRMLNVRNRGWPPAHCDADGAFKPKEEEP